MILVRLDAWKDGRGGRQAGRNMIKKEPEKVCKI
jgi:hypothetical protein